MSISQASPLVRQAKRARSAKRQRGQFLTPPSLARRVIEPALSSSVRRVLEPSFGSGGFLIPLISHFIAQGAEGSENARLGRVLSERVWGVEVDEGLYERALTDIAARWGPLPRAHNLVLGDYFRSEPPFGGFDLITGNPPFGGTFDAQIEDQLDRRFGSYQGDKIKKETYSFFVAKAVGELALDGSLRFICSDTFLTIQTMKGLRRLLIDRGVCDVARLETFSEETSQPMVVLSLKRGRPADHVRVLGSRVARETMELTGNFSWGMTDDISPYFSGPSLGHAVIATGGMTIGNNELFVRKIHGGTIEEHFDFTFFNDPITLDRELQRARLGKLSRRRVESIRTSEECGSTRRNVQIVRREKPLELALPHPDYRPYNKAASGRLFVPARHVVYWKDDGDAVLTFKKNGPWYLGGVGGRPYFLKEGITWSLVAPRINARYLPPGYVLDSGAPCAFLRPGEDPDELWFVLGWLQTALATTLLKRVLNHTRNIQSKDIERLPYPFWVTDDVKRRVASMTRDAVGATMQGQAVRASSLAADLDHLFTLREVDGRFAARDIAA